MYSQNAEEAHILNYFNNYLVGFKGSFIDIGANDGVTFSNTRKLAELGWKGVLVEPSPKAFSKLKDNYKNLTGFYFYPFAIGGVNGESEFFESGTLLKNGDVGLVSTFHQSEIDRFKSAVTYNPIKVKTFRWKTFLNRVPIKEFDFISIDTEGENYDILCQIDLFNTSLLCIEFNGHEDLKIKMLDYASKYGLKKLIYTSGENLIISR